MKKLLIKSILLTVLLTGWNATALAQEATFTPAEVCKYLNYQHQSVDQPTQGNKDTENKFKDKLVVITEERLGNPDNKFTFICYREIKCTAPGSTADTTTTNGTAEGATPSPTIPPTNNATTPPALRKCTTTYNSECSGGMSHADITRAQKDRTDYNICEPVMVYMSGAGTDLLYFYMGQIYRYMAGIGGLVAVLVLIIAGIMWTTAGDNTNQITIARNMVTKSITGLVLLFLTAIILYTINPNFFVI